MKHPVFKLNNGVELPALGLGVFRSGEEGTVEAVKAALSVGYRMIDTAAAYGNEAYVGQGLRESDVPREEVVIQTKLWMSDYGFDKALHGFDRSMKTLGLETLDVYLLHWPQPKLFDLTIESWKALSRLLKEGRIRAIGVCNASVDQMKKLTDATGITPVLNQIEMHPYFSQAALREAIREMGVVPQAWSPLGGVSSYSGDGSLIPLKDEVLIGLSGKYNKTVAQIILRWHLQNGVSIIPKSVTPGRIRENADLFDFELEAGDIAAIDALDRGQRAGIDPQVASVQYFGRVIED
ncbi:aldo/keto reductase [Hoeflea sp. WL0058]|uniref:Aldo/keto reductase n=1 Tax=Flavimaribacter sediminis TaxID=2865987 RepID=A0AAE2ZP01_9HYPH|nr:aldo/keto reductase [Flavimaribacter sediminis]MBW8640083.1 aldo/keto reductase [Flavimaribacter sediminis]